MRSSFSKLTFALLIVVLLGLGIWFFLSSKPEPVVTIEIPKSKTSIIGYSVENRSIEHYSFGNGPDHILFVGGIHGGYEWNSVLLANTLIDYLELNPDIIPANLTANVIPVLNPDGLSRVVGTTTTRFTADNVLASAEVQAAARFNANNVDLNRNFDCKWQPESKWRNKVVSAGSNAFSEPETRALRDLVLEIKPKAVIFWHSQANTVYASECHSGILPVTADLMTLYAKSAAYLSSSSFSSYEITGAAEDWLASINIPAITVELKTHETIEWSQNLAGVKAVLQYFNTQL